MAVCVSFIAPHKERLKNVHSEFKSNIHIAELKLDNDSMKINMPVLHIINFCF